MKADEVISKAELFTMNFITKIQDKSEQPGRRQTYFLDNQDELKKYMGALQKIVSTTNDVISSEGTLSEDDALLAQRATEILDRLKLAMDEFQKELMIQDSVTEEDTTAVLTEKTLDDAMKTNKTTQEISANMTAIAEQQKATANVGYNYALVCDGAINLIGAQDKAQLNDSINAIANTGNFKSIQLYELKFTPVPLKKKTVLTV